MSTDQWTTTDLSRFGSRERRLLITLLIAWQEQGLPEDFEDDEVQPMMNLQSGNVFLTNTDYQVAMMNGDTLESWYYTPYEGHEGFLEDLEDAYSEMHPDDQEYMDQIKEHTP